jgi:hypothetical protein
MSQFPISYYFSVRNPESELATALPFIASLAGRATERTRPPATVLAGRVLDLQVRGYLQLLATNFLRIDPGAPTELLLQAYLADHLQSNEKR